MDALTASGCRFILNEVFECENLDDLLRRGDSFFSLLPEPKFESAGRRSVALSPGPGLTGAQRTPAYARR